MVLTYLLLIFSLEKAFAGNDNIGIHLDDDYFGPANSEVTLDPYHSKVIFIDDLETEAYLFKTLQLEMLELKYFLEGEYVAGIQCPDHIYTQYKDTIEYGIRLVSMSYIFEALRDYEYQAKILGINEACQPNYNKLINECRPQSSRMKSFVRNSQVVINQLDQIVVPFRETKKKSQEKWYSSLKQGKANHLIGSRLISDCHLNNCIKKSSIKIINRRIQNICSNEQKLFLDICSERDKLKGISYIREVFPLLLSSDTFKEFPDKSYQYGCLKRYVSSQKKNEFKYNELEIIFKHFYSRFWESQNASYQRGRLFSIGSMYEYENKGLGDIFKNEVKKIKKVSQKIDKQIEKPVFEVIELPKFQKKKKIKKKTKVSKIVKTKKVKKPKNSVFKDASDLRRSLDLSQVALDMGRFLSENVFTEIEIKRLSVASGKFTAQKSLNDMKKFDKLGSRKAPVPLSFLKFLILNEKHQGLFNIVLVLGEQFYVTNNIDKNISRNESELVKLKNDAETNFKWQIYIIKP